MGVPTYGAIILDETLDNVSMLVPGLMKNNNQKSLRESFFLG